MREPDVLSIARGCRACGQRSLPSSIITRSSHRQPQASIGRPSGVVICRVRRYAFLLMWNAQCCEGLPCSEGMRSAAVSLAFLCLLLRFLLLLLTPFPPPLLVSSSIIMVHHLLLLLHRRRLPCLVSALLPSRLLPVVLEENV